MTAPRISIVEPMYNVGPMYKAGRFIDKSLFDIRGLSVVDREILVISDGLKTDGPAILADHAGASFPSAPSDTTPRPARDHDQEAS